MVTIYKQTGNMLLREGQGVVLRVWATGDPVLEYQWYKNDQSMSGENESSYTIPNVDVINYQGNYHCVVSTTSGPETDISEVMVVKLTDRQHVTQKLFMEYMDLGTLNAPAPWRGSVSGSINVDKNNMLGDYTPSTLTFVAYYPMNRGCRLAKVVNDQLLVCGDTTDSGGAPVTSGAVYLINPVDGSLTLQTNQSLTHGYAYTGGNHAMYNWGSRVFLGIAYYNIDSAGNIVAQEVWSDVTWPPNTWNTGFVDDGGHNNIENIIVARDNTAQYQYTGKISRLAEFETGGGGPDLYYLGYDTVSDFEQDGACAWTDHNTIAYFTETGWSVAAAYTAGIFKAVPIQASNPEIDPPMPVMWDISPKVLLDGASHSHVYGSSMDGIAGYWDKVYAYGHTGDGGVGRVMVVYDEDLNVLQRNTGDAPASGSLRVVRDFAITSGSMVRGSATKISYYQRNSTTGLLTWVESLDTGSMYTYPLDVWNDKYVYVPIASSGSAGNDTGGVRVYKYT